MANIHCATNYIGLSKTEKLIDQRGHKNIAPLQMRTLNLCYLANINRIRMTLYKTDNQTVIIIKLCRKHHSAENHLSFSGYQKCQPIHYSALKLIGYGGHEMYHLIYQCDSDNLVTIKLLNRRITQSKIPEGIQQEKYQISKIEKT